MLRSISALLLCALPAFASEVTVLTAGRVHTLDPQRPVAEALVWDAGGRLLAVGSRAQLTASCPGAARIDVGDATVIPVRETAYVARSPPSPQRG
jgi:hypothetical protein